MFVLSFSSHFLNRRAPMDDSSLFLYNAMSLFYIYIFLFFLYTRHTRNTRPCITGHLAAQNTKKCKNVWSAPLDPPLVTSLAVSPAQMLNILYLMEAQLCLYIILLGQCSKQRTCRGYPKLTSTVRINSRRLILTWICGRVGLLTECPLCNLKTSEVTTHWQS